MIQTPSGRKIFRSNVVKSANHVPAGNWGDGNQHKADNRDCQPTDVVTTEHSVNFGDDDSSECAYNMSEGDDIDHLADVSGDKYIVTDDMLTAMF